jgi:preprotein translocase subunit YajC
MNKLLSGFALLQAAPATGNASGSMVMTLGTFGAVFVIFYFLIIRPQNKKQKETKRMIEAVKKGDRVVTAGGVHATVYTVKEKTVILKVDENTKMEFSKSAIAGVEPKGGDEKIEALKTPDSDVEKPTDGKK